MDQQHMLVEVNSLKKYFPIRSGFFRTTSGYVKAVDDVSFGVREGETLGVVGESGCGKTTLGRCILRAIEPTQGEIGYRFDGEAIDIIGLSLKELRQLRPDMQMIFQDPYSSLNARMSVFDIIAEPLVIGGGKTRKQIVERVEELMGLVGLNAAYMRRYPHAFSGGQRQRIAIARSLATNPRFIVCDEPVSALDVSVRAQILNLLLDLQSQLNLTYLFITHDLSVIHHISHRVMVMYVGKIVEQAVTTELFRRPMHPYTEALLSAIPMPDPRQKLERIILPGEVANPAHPPSGCYFHPRCRYAQEICRVQAPELVEVAPGHFAACHFARELDLRGVVT